MTSISVPAFVEIDADLESPVDLSKPGLLAAKDTSSSIVGGESLSEARAPGSQGSPVIETNVVFWHPDRPVVFYRFGTPDELIDGMDVGRVELNVREVEIRSGASGSTTPALIFRFRTNVNEWGKFLKDRFFGLSLGTFRPLQIVWDDASPIDVELYFDDHGDTELDSAVLRLASRGTGPEVVDPAKSIIAAFANDEFSHLKFVYNFKVLSARQAQPDETQIGFDSSDIERIDKLIRAGAISDAPLPTDDTRESWELNIVERETKVIFWHPDKPIVLRADSPEEARAQGDYAERPFPINVHEVEIRLGSARHETFTVILRLKADKAFVDACLEIGRFRFIEAAFQRLNVTWDDSRPFDIELHYRRTGPGLDLLKDLSALRESRADHFLRDLDPSDTTSKPPPFDFEKVIIAGLTSGQELYLSNVSSYQLRSIRQTLANGKVIGFDFNAIDALMR